MMTADTTQVIPMAPTCSVHLFGVRVDALTMGETVARAREMVAEGTPHQHVVVNAAKLVQISREPALRAVVESCDLVSADGMSVVWASRILARPLPERVAGIDLFEQLVAAARDDGTAVYFLGATDEVVRDVVRVFEHRYPGLHVAGYHHGFWDDDEAVVADIRAARPDYLFLAIPSPRKEFWLKDHLGRLGVPFVMGVGGSFDVVAGKTGRAPRVVQQSGLEWAWRLAQEPRRMWKRYLFTNTAFIVMTARAWWRSVR
jgi:N-acetylglucosaminyldiphosphoundecaprenol N-acetyl-beta-D-mannosaminyltransferase